MQFARKELVETKGQSFYKLMGSGRDSGFSIWPDFSIYSLLQVWDNEEAANKYLKNSRAIEDYRYRAEKVHTIFCRSITSHGYWSNKNPFLQNPALLDTESPIVVSFVIS